MKTLPELKANFLKNFHTHGNNETKFERELARETAYKPLPNLANHKQQFSLEPSPIFRLLETFATVIEPELIEPSVKVSPQGIFPERCNLYYYDLKQLPEIMLEIFRFFEEIEKILGQTLNYSAYEYLIDQGFSLDHCRNVVLGVDLRKDTAQSRVKIYFLLQEGSNQIIKSLYQFGEQSQNVNPLFLKWTTLFGIDFKFDGTNHLKAYPGFPPYEYQKLQASMGFGEETMQLIKQAPFCMMSALDRFSPLQLLLPGQVITQFINHPLVDTMEPNTYYILSLLPKEIENKKSVNFNIYYNEHRFSGI